nr:hypothetical protein [Tanacetum cinerariifolium]
DELSPKMWDLRIA